METFEETDYNGNKYKQLLGKNTKVLNQYFTAFTASLSLITAAGLQSWTTSEIPKHVGNSDTTHDGFSITQDEADFIIAIIPAAAIIGPILNVYFINKIGRKYTLILIKIQYAIAAIYLYFVNGYISLMIASLLAVINYTLTTSVVNVYIAEIASPQLRGGLCGVMLVMGTLAVSVGFGISSLFNVTQGATIFLGFMIVSTIPEIFMPRSPYFLLAHEQREQARKAVSFLYHKDVVEMEVKRLTSKMKASTLAKSSITQFFTNRSNLKSILLNVTLNIAASYSGMSLMDYLMPTLLQNGCYKVLDPDLCSIVLSIVSCLTTALAAYLLTKIPRRVMHISSTLALVATLVATGTYYYLIQVDKDIAAICDYLPFGFLLILYTLFSFGVGSMPQVYFRDLMPINFVATATFVCDVTGPAVAWSAVLCYQFIQNIWSLTAVFGFYAIVTLVCLYIFVRFIPESKNKFMEEVFDNLAE